MRDLIVEQRREQQRLIQVREALSADVEQGRATLEVLLRSNDADLKVRTRQRLATAQAQHTRATELLLRVQSTLEEKEAELQRGLRTLRVPALPRAD